MTTDQVANPEIRSVPVTDRPQDNTATPLSKLVDGNRAPWVWSNLDEDEALELHLSVLWFVDTYNNQYVTDLSEVIPACWPLHPRMVHELPVVYWAWWAAHRAPTATVGDATRFYGDTLPKFQSRIASLMGATFSECRRGTHSDDSAELLGAIRRARETAPLPAQAHRWRQQTFGA
jgi:hypothetical protein